jgi:hypothetical protein
MTSSLFPYTYMYAVQKKYRLTFGTAVNRYFLSAFRLLFKSLFLDPGGFAPQFAQIIDFSASDPSPGKDFYFIDDG